MPQRPRRSPRPPTLAQALALHDRHEMVLIELAGRWSDSLPATVRATLLRLSQQKTRLLVRAGLRGSDPDVLLGE